jgi:acetyl-CoA carboxylase biotin carboxyl carrier protein
MTRAGRLHAPEVDAIVAAPDDGVIELRAPSNGVFVPAVATGDLVAPGGVLGELSVLGRASAVRVPRGATSGIAVRVITAASHAVSFGDALVAIDPSLQHGSARAGATTAVTATAATGLVFRAPTSGRFYGRSSPDKPAFVAPGSELTTGATICLLEVMKTFHRVTFGGPGLPDTARVVRVLVADGDDVNAGDPLLALE